MLSRLFDRLRGRRAATPLTGAHALEAALQKPVEETDCTTLVPIIVPGGAMDGWPGPIVPIQGAPFAVAWATMPGTHLFVYVSGEQADFWERTGADWRGEAMRNLARIAAESPWKGQKDDAEGRPFVLALLTDDAIGPSRLLLPHLYEDMLGPGYCVAIPERTCAIAYRSSLGDDERADVDGMIEGCFEHGTEPMSLERFDPRVFWTFGDPRATGSNAERR